MSVCAKKFVCQFVYTVIKLIFNLCKIVVLLFQCSAILCTCILQSHYYHHRDLQPGPWLNYNYNQRYDNWTKIMCSKRPVPI